MTDPSSVQSSTLPLSCPRCATRAAGDWCCWELKDLELRVERGETTRQLAAVFVGRSVNAIRKAVKRYKLGKPAAVATRRRGCPACGALFEPAPSDQKACAACRGDLPAEERRAA